MPTATLPYLITPLLFLLSSMQVRMIKEVHPAQAYYLRL
jgi:hypothetical protein